MADTYSYQFEEDNQKPTKTPARIAAFSGSAGELVQAFGSYLVGQKIDTQRKAIYPGGLAEVTELTPDANAPEICLQVRHCETGEVVGIFEDERVKGRARITTK